MHEFKWKRWLSSSAPLALILAVFTYSMSKSALLRWLLAVVALMLPATLGILSRAACARLSGPRVELIELTRVTHLFAEDKLTYAATAT